MDQLLEVITERHPEIDLAEYGLDNAIEDFDYGEDAAQDIAENITNLLEDNLDYDGVIFNFPDGGREYTVFNPTQIRSVHAAFDPARREEALLLAQPPVPAFEAEQDFAGVEITDEMTVEETGEVVTVTQDAQTVWNRLQKRRNMVDQLRGCLNA